MCLTSRIHGIMNITFVDVHCMYFYASTVLRFLIFRCMISRFENERFAWFRFRSRLVHLGEEYGRGGMAS